MPKCCQLHCWSREFSQEIFDHLRYCWIIQFAVGLTLTIRNVKSWRMNWPGPSKWRRSMKRVVPIVCVTGICDPSKCSIRWLSGGFPLTSNNVISNQPRKRRPSQSWRQISIETKEESQLLWFTRIFTTIDGPSIDARKTGDWIQSSEPGRNFFSWSVIRTIGQTSSPTARRFSSWMICN